MPQWLLLKRRNKGAIGSMPRKWTCMHGWIRLRGRSLASMSLMSTLSSTRGHLRASMPTQSVFKAWLPLLILRWITWMYQMAFLQIKSARAIFRHLITGISKQVKKESTISKRVSRCQVSTMATNLDDSTLEQIGYTSKAMGYSDKDQGRSSPNRGQDPRKTL